MTEYGMACATREEAQASYESWVQQRPEYVGYKPVIARSYACDISARWYWLVRVP